MNKKWFDFSLYKEGLRQGMGFTLLAGLIFCLEAVLFPLGRLIGAGGWLFSPSNSVRYAYFFNMHPIAIMTYCFFAPLMAIYLFRFLTKRDGCDFYHAIPQTRTCLYISFSAAVLTLAFLLQWGSSAVSAFVHLIFRSGFDIDWMNFLYTNIRISICTLLVTAAVNVAVSLTGNTLSNLITSLMIIFAPRVLMLAMSQIVRDTLSIITDGEGFGLMGWDWNMVTDSVLRFYHGWDNGIGSARSLVYTLILAVIYFVLGGYCFNRRKSEMAGSAAVSSKLQLAFRTIPAMIFCLIPGSMIFNIIVNCEEYGREKMFWIVVLYIIGILIYFLYELVSTRKIKAMGKAAPGLVVLVAVNALIIGGMCMMRSGLLSFSPSADQVDSVSIDLEKGVYYYEGADYLSTEASKAKLTDPELIELLTKRLAEEVQWEKEGGTWTIEEAAYPSDEATDNTEPAWKTKTYSWQDVTFHVGSKSVKRVMFITNEDFAVIAKALKQDPHVEATYMNFPKLSNPDVTMGLRLDSEMWWDYTEEDKSLLYEAFQEDVRDMGFEKWYQYYEVTKDQIGEADRGDYGYDFLHMYLIVGTGSEKNQMEMVITNATPKARDCYMELSGEAHEKAKLNTMEVLEKMMKNDGSLEIFFLDASYMILENGHEKEIYFFDAEQPEKLESLYSFIKNNAEHNIDYSKKYARVTISSHYVENELDYDASDVFYLGIEE